jgi:trimethylamine--corrinoid protein Co-methyltransferase
MLDGEQAEMFYRLAQGPQFADLDEALAALQEVGPGGHFLGTRHTQDHFQSAFFMPELLDNNSYDQWQAEGATDAAERALAKARAQLDRYDEIAPALDPAVDEELRAFIAAREAELPDVVS